MSKFIFQIFCEVLTKNLEIFIIRVKNFQMSRKHFFRNILVTSSAVFCNSFEIKKKCIFIFIIRYFLVPSLINEVFKHFISFWFCRFGHQMVSKQTIVNLFTIVYFRPALVCPVTCFANQYNLSGFVKTRYQRSQLITIRHNSVF